MTNGVSFTCMVAVGIAGGLLGWKLKIPGGTIIFSMLAASLYNLLGPLPQHAPQAFSVFSQIIIGIVVGASFQPDMLPILRNNWYVFILSGAAIIFCGFIISVVLLKTMDFDLPTAYLAGSPGAMSSMIGLAASTHANLSLVMVFHLVRIYMVTLSVPLAIRFLRHFFKS